MSEKRYFKIRDPKTGLYSKGGGSPRWTKHGKEWHSLGALKNHINLLFGHSNSRKHYEGCELIEFVLTETSHAMVNLQELIASTQTLKAQKEVLRQIRSRAYERKRLAEQIARDQAALEALK
jgi:hypothetical protein